LLVYDVCLISVKYIDYLGERKMKRSFIWSPVVAAALAAFAWAPSHASTVAVSWYEVNVATAGTDFGAAQCCQTLNNEVQTGLSGGRPVLNNAGSAPLAESPGTVLPWWTPGGAVTLESTNSNYTLPASQNMFVPNGTGVNPPGDSVHYQTAIFTGNLTIAAGGTIFFGGDDDVFLALNGQIVDQIGGVHSTTDDTYTIPVGGGGTYALTLFYADRDQVDANLQFSTTGTLTAAVPEPSTWAMMILGFLGVGFMAYRRKSNGPAFRIA
jgi:fibro-slime domain-containing protein